MRISDWSSDVCSSDLERADFLAEPESLLAVVAAAGSAAGRETRLQNLPDGHHDDDAEDHFEWIHVRFSPFSLSSVERIGGPVVAQLVDLVGNRDALVGGDPDRKSTRLNSSH